MQDLKLLHKRGGTEEELKKKFEAKKPDAKIKRLTELHASRIRRAIETNISEAPVWGAIDRALEAAHHNLTYIQARELAASGKSNEEIIAAFQRFNLDRLLEPVIDPTTGEEMPDPKSKTGKMLTFNKPLFDGVFVPLVAAYCDIRAGKLFNDRDTYPRYKYSPGRMTAKDMMACDIVTGRVQRMTQDMGYAADDKQSFKQMVYYGTCFNFIRESWHREQYVTEDGDKEVEKTVREGVRFVIPHPRRSFWDRSYPAYTLNYDNGVGYCGYWDIMRYGDISDNPQYWNRDKITTGGYDLFRTNAWSIYQQFYPCVIQLPKVYSSVGPNNPDRIEAQQSLMKDELDASVNVCVLFDKVVPKDWNLFDYDKPVWMRFVYVNLENVIHAEVLPFAPGYVYLDRYDSNKTINSSMGLQLVPFQQLLGNFITQHIMSVKQNLTRINFVNTDIVPKEQITFLRRMKDRIQQSVAWLMFSKQHNAISDSDQREAIIPAPNPQVNTQEISQNINMVLGVLERMLGFTAQEVGAAASHEQSATEIHVTSRNNSVNLQFMASGIDEAYSAKKRLLYNAFYSYGDDEVFTDVSDLTPERKKAIEELGFSVEDGSKEGDPRFGVKGKKAALTIDSFVSDREGVNRFSDSKLGIAMLQNLGTVAQNPALFQVIGPEQMIKLFQYVWKMVGLPEDFKLIAKAPDGQAAAEAQQAQQQQFMQALQQAQQAIVQSAVQIVDEQIKQQVVGPLTQELAALSQGVQQVAQSGEQQDAAQNQAIQSLSQSIAEMQQFIEGMAAQQQQLTAFAVQSQQNAIVQPNPGPALIA